MSTRWPSPPPPGEWLSIDPGDRPPIYGNGGAAARILDLLVEHFAPAPEPVP